MKHRSRSVTPKKTWLTLFPVIAVIITGWKFLPQLFPITRVECFTRQEKCDTRYLEKLSFVINRPLLWSLPDTEVKSQLDQFPEIEKFNLHRRLPGTLVVNVFQRDVIGLISGKVLGENIAVDSSGFAYAPLQSETLPVLTSDTFSKYPSALDATTLQGIIILSKTQDLFDQPLHGSMQKNSLFIDTNQGLRVVFDINHLPENWLNSLQLVLSRSKMGSKIPQIIDLRYTDPVLTY